MDKRVTGECKRILDSTVPRNPDFYYWIIGVVLSV